MKSSIVPAQVTSHEDTITANLTLTQIILLIIPVFICTLVLSTIPPFMHLTLVKLIIALFISLPFLILSLRINGTLVLALFKLRVSFYSRPHLYLMSLRPKCLCDKHITIPHEEKIEKTESHTYILDTLNPQQLVLLKHSLKDKRVIYRSNNGVFNAVIETK